jgi:hypothetical protein
VSKRPSASEASRREKNLVSFPQMFREARKTFFHLYENKYLTRVVISINPPLRART